MTNGTQDTHNLTADERIGLIKLQKRVKDGELVIIRSDKGNRFTVSSLESYERQGDVHTLKDRKISLAELDQIQIRMNCLSRGLASVTTLGANWGEANQARCWANLACNASIAPLLYPSPKTHKPLDPQGDPKTRPIVQASSCVTSRPGEILADIMDAALQAQDVQQECKITEEMLARVDAATKVINEEGIDVCVGSGDVVGLYPSLKHQESAKLCGSMVTNSQAVFSNIDYKAAGVFVAVHCTENEIKKAGLSKVVPKRVFKMGKHPVPSTLELNTRRDESLVPSKFRPIREDLSEQEKKSLLGKVVEVGVLQVLRNHAYRWKGDVWLQTLGVPTGLRVSGIIGRVCMDHWRGKMMNLMIMNNMKSYLCEKYVDDAEVVVENVEAGTRWNGKSLEVTKEAAQEDIEEGKLPDQVTMEAWGAMASSILPGITFTVEYASKTQAGTVAMLDFQLWKEREPVPGEPDQMRETLRYAFFEKEMSNPQVMDVNSALPHKVKVATLTQEGVRGLCNSSRELPTSHKCQILTTYMRKLQASGYNQCLRANILEGAVTTFLKKCKAEQLGIQPVHRLGSHNLEERRRTKLQGKTEWFRPGKTSWKTKLKQKEESCSKDNNQQPGDQSGQPHHPHQGGPPGRRVAGVGGVSVGGSRAPKDQGQQPAPHSLNQPQNPPAVTPSTAKMNNKDNNNRVEAVLFVPHTPGGLLSKKIQAVEDTFAKLHKVARVKVVERGGTKLMNMLGRKDPWAPSSCGERRLHGLP